MNLPSVAIIGRPNVGKSSLFNRILHKKTAVVDDLAGVTRDRHYAQTCWNGITFNIIDTGGMIPSASQSIAAAVNRQVEIAIDDADVVVFMVENNALGPTDEDLQIARFLKKTCFDKLILAVNKAESKNAIFEINSQLSLGCGSPVAISALHGNGVGDLLDEITDRIKKRTGIKRDKDVPSVNYDLNITILGRPNAGKSSLVNKLLSHERMIVDNAPGTTRDAVDSILTYQEKKIRIIDTAGLRKKSNVNEGVEYFSNLRALRSITQADVCVVVIDTSNEMGEQDMKIFHQIFKHKRGCIICWNKWDLIEKDHKTYDHLMAETRDDYADLANIPMISVSALTGLRIHKILEIAFQIKTRMDIDIPNKELEDNFFSWVKTQPHPFKVYRPVRFLGIKQIKSYYPLFTVFCTNPHAVDESYKRFLVKKFHETYDLQGCPVTVQFRAIRKQGFGSASK